MDGGGVTWMWHGSGVIGDRLEYVLGKRWWDGTGWEHLEVNRAGLSWQHATAHLSTDVQRRSPTVKQGENFVFLLFVAVFRGRIHHNKVFMVGGLHPGTMFARLCARLQS